MCDISVLIIYYVMLKYCDQFEIFWPSSLLVRVMANSTNLEELSFLAHSACGDGFDNLLFDGIDELLVEKMKYYIFPQRT